MRFNLVCGCGASVVLDSSSGDYTVENKTYAAFEKWNATHAECAKLRDLPAPTSVVDMQVRSRLREAVIAAFPLLRRIRDRTDVVQFFEANAAMGMIEDALKGLPPDEKPALRTIVVTDAMVDRFLTWPLPESVCADGVASQPNVPPGVGIPVPRRTGTNLLSAIEAKAMLEHVIAGDPLALMVRVMEGPRASGAEG